MNGSTAQKELRLQYQTGAARGGSGAMSDPIALLENSTLTAAQKERLEKIDRFIHLFEMRTAGLRFPKP